MCKSKDANRAKSSKCTRRVRCVMRGKYVPVGVLCALIALCPFSAKWIPLVPRRVPWFRSLGFTVNCWVGRVNLSMVSSHYVHYLHSVCYVGARSVHYVCQMRLCVIYVLYVMDVPVNVLFALR